MLIGETAQRKLKAATDYSGVDMEIQSSTITQNRSTHPWYSRFRDFSPCSCLAVSISVITTIYAIVNNYSTTAIALPITGGVFSVVVAIQARRLAEEADISDSTQAIVEVAKTIRRGSQDLKKTADEMKTEFNQQKQQDTDLITRVTRTAEIELGQNREMVSTIRSTVLGIKPELDALTNIQGQVIASQTELEMGFNTDTNRLITAQDNLQQDISRLHGDVQTLGSTVSDLKCAGSVIHKERESFEGSTEQMTQMVKAAQSIQGDEDERFQRQHEENQRLIDGLTTLSATFANAMVIPIQVQSEKTD